MYRSGATTQAGGITGRSSRSYRASGVVQSLLYLKVKVDSMLSAERCAHNNKVKMNILKASRRASAVAAACLLFAGMATANPLTYQGTFSADDEHVSVPINLAGSGTLTAITSSWALGGFAPMLTLFGGAGGYQQDVGSARICGSVGSGSPDTATGFCWDADFTASLPAGNYLLVLTQDDNLANGDTLADGFSHDGTPNYTSLNYLGVSNGPLCINVDASQRSCNFAMTVDVALNQVGAVPEPGSLALFGLAGLALRARQAVPDARRAFGAGS